MSYNNNPLKNKMLAAQQRLEELAWEIRRDLELEMSKYDAVYNALTELTSNLQPDAKIGNLEDEMLETLMENPEWADLYGTWSFLDASYGVEKKIQSCIETAAWEVGKFT